MTHYEYKVIPAPAKGTKTPGVKAPEARLANTVEALLNLQAAEGWDYMRTDILPSDERQGLTSTQTVYRTLMVFRRAKAEEENAADEVISTAQSVAEAVSPDVDGPDTAKRERREPALTPIQPSRADPAAPVKTPTEPGPEPDAPGPQTPKES